jgi:hypothetical protein
MPVVLVEPQSGSDWGYPAWNVCRGLATSRQTEKEGDMGTQEQAARMVWQYGEPIHAALFFAPETRTETDELGLKGGWMIYFGCRAAPLGAVSAAVVTSIFYGFHAQRVERAIPDVWDCLNHNASLTPDSRRWMRRLVGFWEKRSMDPTFGELRRSPGRSSLG